MIRFLLRVTLVGTAVGWLAERALTALAGDRPPEPVRSRVVVDAPIERVWEELADVEGQPRWMHDMKAVRVLTRGSIGVGSRAEADVRILGVQVLDPITITAFEPPRRFAIRHDGKFSGEGLIELEEVDRSTTIVRWDETIVPPYLPRLWSALFRPVLQRVFQADLERFRLLVEAGSADR